MAEEKKQSEQLELAKQYSTGNSNALSVGLKFADYKDLLAFADILAGGDKAAANKLCPLKTKEEVFIALLAGAAMKLPIPVALNNIVPINGKATISNSLQMALLTKEGVTMDLVEDFQPLYPVFYYDYNNDGTPKVETKDGKQVPVILEVKHLFRSEVEQLVRDFKETAATGIWTDVEQKINSVKVMWKPSGYGTKVKLTRQIKQPDGSYKDQTYTRSYTTIDAANVRNSNGESVMQTKDSWKNYLADMLFANAFRRTAKLIGNDILLNLNSTEEMLDTTNINYNLDEEGSIKILDGNGKVVRTVSNNQNVTETQEAVEVKEEAKVEEKKEEAKTTTETPNTENPTANDNGNKEEVAP